MYLELGENPLGMVPGGVGADLEFPRNRLVGPALSQEGRYLDLPAGKAKACSQTATLRAVGVRGGPGPMLPLQTASQLAELVNRAVQRLHQCLIVIAQVRERGKKTRQFV